MQSLKRFTTVFLLLSALISEAQPTEIYYRLMLKGQPSPFDSAVVIRIDRYRQETYQEKVMRNLIAGFHQEVDSLRAQIFIKNETLETIQIQNMALRENLDSVKVTVNRLSGKFDDLFKKADNKPSDPWWETWWVWALAGALGSYFIFH